MNCPPELLLREAGEFDDEGPFWTGGIANTAAGKTFLLWHSSREPIEFSNFVRDHT